MNRKIRRITETAALLAMVISLQWVGSMIPEPITKQLISGTCVNCVLAVAALYCGYGSGVVIALLSPVCAYMLNIAPNIITVLPIMLGNVCYVVLLRLICAKNGRYFWRWPVGLAAAAFVKFSVLYVLVVKMICGLLADDLMGQKVGQTVILAPLMLEKLPFMFSWMQLVTAFAGGVIAFSVVPVLRKALRK